MRLSKRKYDTKPPMNMTPMIDIVFLLIIFFMTVNQVTEINRERVALPELEGSQDQAPSVLTVNIDQQGAMRVSGREVSLLEVVSTATDQIARLGGDPARLTVVVRADRRGASRAVNRVVEALGGLGVAKVNIAVQSEGG